jgi:hypothetical protein
MFTEPQAAILAQTSYSGIALFPVKQWWYACLFPSDADPAGIMVEILQPEERNDSRISSRGSAFRELIPPNLITSLALVAHRSLTFLHTLLKSETKVSGFE